MRRRLWTIVFAFLVQNFAIYVQTGMIMLFTFCCCCKFSYFFTHLCGLLQKCKRRRYLFFILFSYENQHLESVTMQESDMSLKINLYRF